MMFPPHRLQALNLGQEGRRFRFRVGDEEYLIPQDEIYNDLASLKPGVVIELVLDGYWAEMELKPEKR
jgi:hypothetical protein